MQNGSEWSIPSAFNNSPALIFAVSEIWTEGEISSNSTPIFLSGQLDSQWDAWG
jgi:hypothetical protein